MNNFKEMLRYDLLNPRGHGAETYWQRVGVLFRQESGVLVGRLFAAPLSGRIIAKPVNAVSAKPTEAEKPAKPVSNETQNR